MKELKKTEEWKTSMPHAGSDVDLGVDSDKDEDAVGVDSDTEGNDAEEER